MMNNMVLTFEQVDGKLLMTIELVKPEHPNPTMIRSNDGNTETIEFVNPPLSINTNQCGIDLSKYKPFPKDYTIPKNTKVIAVEDSRHFDHGAYSKGKLGVVIKNEVYEEKYVSVVFNDKPLQILMYSHELAPLDPSDHPDYKPEEPEQRPINAVEIVEWVYDYAGISILHKEPLERYINEAIQYELNKAKR